MVYIQFRPKRFVFYGASPMAESHNIEYQFEMSGKLGK